MQITTLTPENMQKTLEWLGAHLGIPIHRKEMDDAARRGDATGPLALFSKIGNEGGLRLNRVLAPLDAVVRDIDSSTPWVTVTDKGPVVLLGAKRGKVLAIWPGRSGSVKWVPAEEAAPAGVDIEWLVAEAAAPLSTMRSKDQDSPADPWTRLRALLQAEKRTLWVAVVYSIVIGLLTLVVPVAVQSVVNTIAFGSVIQPLVYLTLLVLLALGFSAVLNTMRAWVVELLQRSLFARVGIDLTWRLLRVRSEAFDKYHGPELVNRFFDVVTVQKSAALLLIDGLTIFMQTLIGLILVALYHPLLLAFDLFLVLAMLFIVFVLGRGAVHTSIKESKAKYAFQAWLEQIASHLITFKSFGGASLAAAKAEELLAEYLLLREKHFKVLVRQIAGSFLLQAVASSLLLGIGGWLVIERQLTLGQLVASELIVTLMVSGFTKFGKQLEVFYDMQAAVDKLGGLVDLPLERAGGEARLTSVKPAEVTFTGVELGFDQGAPVLAIPSFRVESGDRLALVGRHGCGKSILADLLFGLRNSTGGSIHLDAADYRDIPLETLREQVALVRGVEVFAGTVLENIRLGRDHLSIQDINRALQNMCLLDEIQAMPEGLNTKLHPTGRPLSQSQAARLMLARAVVGRPRLLVLDDALDMIDRPQERDPICQMLFSPEAPWTAICISERPDLVSHCNRIALMEGGAIREISRKEVLA